MIRGFILTKNDPKFHILLTQIVESLRDLNFLTMLKIVYAFQYLIVAYDGFMTASNI